MATRQRRAGVLIFKVDGTQYDAKGTFTYSPGFEKKTAIVGADKVHGFAGERTVPHIEGAITDAPELALAALLALDDVTVTLELANEKTFMLRNAWYAGEGNPSTEQAEIPVRFEGLDGEEIS